MRRICRTAGHGSQKYAIEISLISVAIGGTGFITEAILAVEYIQATRLALIQAHPGVAFILFLMSFVKCKLCQMNENFSRGVEVKVSGLLGKWTVHKIKQKGPKTWAGGQKGMKVDGLRMRGQSQRDESGRPAKVR